jgi:hypothetical protein
MLRCINEMVSLHDHKTWTSDNWKRVIWSDELSFTLFLTSGRVLHLENSQGSPQSGSALSNSEKRGRFCDGLGSNIIAQYSVGPIITLHGRISAWDYVDRLGNQVHPIIQTLFPNNDAVLQHDSTPSHTTGTVQSWFEENEGELQHLPRPAQPPDLNITEPLRSVL